MSRRGAGCWWVTSAALRHAGVLAALVCLLVAQLASIGHRALVRHAICEHGTVVHTDVHTDHGPYDAGHSEAYEGNAPIVEVAARSDGPHEHCEPAGVRSAPATIGALRVSPTLLDGYRLPWSVRPRAHASLEILSFAPKNSPPV